MTLVIRLSDEVASLISLLYVKFYELPISSGVIRCFNVTSKHCRANLVFGRILVKRQILSVHVYDEIPL
jgi:hypothetical protein